MDTKLFYPSSIHNDITVHPKEYIDSKIDYALGEVNAIRIAREILGDNCVEVKKSIHLEISECMNLLRKKELELHMQVDRFYFSECDYFCRREAKMHSFMSSIDTSIGVLNSYEKMKKKAKTLKEEDFICGQKLEFISNIGELKLALKNYGKVQPSQNCTDFHVPIHEWENFKHPLTGDCFGGDFSHLAPSTDLYGTANLQYNLEAGPVDPMYFADQEIEKRTPFYMSFDRESESFEDHVTSNSEPAVSNPLPLAKQEEKGSPKAVDLLIGIEKKSSNSSLDSFEIIEGTQNLKLQHYEEESAMEQKEILPDHVDSLHPLENLELLFPKYFAERRSKLSEWCREMEEKRWKPAERSHSCRQISDNDLNCNPTLQLQKQPDDIVVEDKCPEIEKSDNLTMSEERKKNLMSGLVFRRNSSINNPSLQLKKQLDLIMNAHIQKPANETSNLNEEFVTSHDLATKYWLQQSNTKKAFPEHFTELKFSAHSFEDKVPNPSIVLQNSLNSYISEQSVGKWLSFKPDSNVS